MDPTLILFVGTAFVAVAGIVFRSRPICLAGQPVAAPASGRRSAVR